MDDFQIEDPRKSSAKKINTTVKKTQKRRTFLQYLFDLLIKTLILFSILALDFTLFANAGNYSLFLSSVELMPEATYIYIAIGALSFVLIFLISWCRPLENIVLSLAAALFCVAIINQFATFDKSSALLIAANGLFSDDINVILYKYSFLIIGAVVFVVVWILLQLLSRSFLFYASLLLLALLAWVLSEAYFNTSIKYYRNVASSPALRSESIGKNLVFLTFRNLTTPNNLLKMSKESKNVTAIEDSVKNTIGFYVNNKFVLYPNALQQNPKDPFINLIASYNPSAKDEASSYVQNTALREGFFNFEALQLEKKFMRQNSLYDMLRKGGYSITVYQPADFDTCYVDNKFAVSTCREKVSIPMTMSNEYFSVIEKTWLLFSQWLISTGFVPSLDPALQFIGYVYDFPELKPLGFKADHIEAVNSYKALEQIAESLDNQNGNQAYFAVIDLPSETYIYDEFCQLKHMSSWSSEDGKYGKNSIDIRRNAYAEQVSCLYGSLEKFMKQLNNSGMLSNTTIVIEGLNNPLGLNKLENDYYAQLQSKSQVSIAIRRPNEDKPQVDYSVCTVGEILNSFFFTHKPCTEFAGMVMAEKLAADVKKQVDEQKYSGKFLTQAVESFNGWFTRWGVKNQFGSSTSEKKPVIKVNIENNTLETANEQEEDLSLEDDEKDEDNTSEIPEENKSDSMLSPNQDKVEEDEVEQDKKEIPTEEKAPMKTEEKQPVIDVVDITENIDKPVIEVPVDETAGKDVIPDTLYDAVKVIQQAETEAAIEKAKRSLEIKKQQEIEDEKQKKKLENAAAEAKVAAKSKVSQVKDKTANIYKNVLEAPVAEGKKLSPEELKKQYHELLKKAATQAEHQEDIEIKVIEN